MMSIHQEDVFRYIPKPWNLQEGQEFRAIIQRAIDHYNLKSEHAGMMAK
jgi:hypothetical protein